MAHTNGAFGGHYNHQVIKELRKELAITKLALAALVEKTGIPQDALQQLASDFLRRQHDDMKAQNKID